MQRVLMLSSDAGLAGAVAAVLRRDGRELRVETDVDRFLLAARDWRPALAVIDLATDPTSNGAAAVLRDPALADHVGVIVAGDVSQLLALGSRDPIDDFIVPPIDPEELSLRISRVLVSRTGADESHVIREGPLSIDLERYKVALGGEVVDLTYKEYELLRFLATNPGKPFTREALLNRVWGYDYYGGSRTVDVHIRRIRAKIERDQQFIETVRNVGYRFIERGASRLGTRLE